MSDLFQLIAGQKNLKILKKALHLLEQTYKIIGIENEDSTTTKKLLNIIETTNHLFDDIGIVSGFSLKSNSPELFHKGCATRVNELKDEQIIFMPNTGKLIHMCHKGDFSLQYLECEKCKKIFRISPKKTTSETPS